MKLPVLLSVPHAGWKVPTEVHNICRLTKKDILEDGDGGAAEIYYPLEREVAAFVTTDIARAIVDLNRAQDDFHKDGVVKTHTCWDVPVYKRPPSDKLVGDLLRKYYRPYHIQLTHYAERVKLGIDCHTMAAVGPPVGPDPGQERPALCLSNSDFTCPRDWIESLAECLGYAIGHPVAINQPFKGGYIVRSHANEGPWLQLEFSRAPFLTLEEKSEKLLAALKEWINQWNL